MNSFEQEINGKLSFLAIEVSRQQGKYVTTVYKKPTFGGVQRWIYDLILGGAQNGTWHLGGIPSSPRGSWAQPQKPTHSQLFAA